MNSKNQLFLFGAILFGGIMGPVLLLFGLRLASAASVSMWLNLELVATALFGHFYFKDHLNRFGWICIVGTITAAVILASGEKIAGIQAGMLVALACLCWGIDNHFTALIDGIRPAQSTFWKGLTAGTTNLIIGTTLSPFSSSAYSVLAGLGIGALSYGISIMFYITAAQKLGATRSQMFFSSAPFFGVMLSAIYLQEIISQAQIFAALILIISLCILYLEKHDHYHRHAALAHMHSHRHDDGHHTHIHHGHPNSLQHTHQHMHEPTSHIHSHWPDIHHRHQHEAPHASIEEDDK